MTEFDFDEWRADYDEISFDEQKACYREIARLFPEQRSFDVEKAREFIARYEPKTVVELGGWDGALANSLGEFVSWRNYDLVAVPQACAKWWYRRVVLDWPFWQFLTVADAFVATHTIEHLRARELEEIVPRLKVHACLIEAPLEDGSTDWAGYPGTHILEIGWEGVDAIFASSGFAAECKWACGRFYAGPLRARGGSVSPGHNAGSKQAG